MKLMDKIKDLFMDDAIDEDEIEIEEEEKEEYKEPKKEELPKVMRDTIEKEEKPLLRSREEFIRETKKELEESHKEIREEKKEIEKPVEPVRKFNFPLDFDEEVTKAEEKEEQKIRDNLNSYEEAFKKTRRSDYGNGNINVLNLEKETTRKVTELYPKKEEPKSKFKASPVISPVYGVLDKNYTKEEVREKAEDMQAIKRPSKKVDFETVRKKAFGNLADDIKDNMLCENCELYKEVKKISALTEDDLLYDMTVDEDKEVTIEKAYDNYRDFGVAYEPKVEKKTPVVEEEAVPETPEKEFVLPPSIEDIINNNNEIIEEEEPKEPYVKMEEKVEEEVVIEQPKEEIKEEIEEVEEEKEVPSRTTKKSDTKKEAKVDDDFFELIDSMYKERIDE